MSENVEKEPVAVENARISALTRTGLLDSAAEPAYDALVELVAGLFDVPMALISLVDEERQWFKAKVGVGVTETPREIAFCDHAIRAGGVFTVPDAALDPRFSNNPLVTGEPNIRFYSGAVLYSDDGFALGTLCILDDKPRPPLEESTRERLVLCARLVEALIRGRTKLDVISGLLSQDIAKSYETVNITLTRSSRLMNRREFDHAIKDVFSTDSAAHGVFIFRLDCHTLLDVGFAIPEQVQERYVANVLKTFGNSALAVGRLEYNTFAVLYATDNQAIGALHYQLQALSPSADERRCSVIGCLIPELWDFRSRSTLYSFFTYYYRNRYRGTEHCIEMYSREYHADILRCLYIRDHLEEAFRQRRLTFVYQPIVDAKTRSILGFESLVRWFDSRGEPINPEILVMVAEEAGYARRLFTYCLDAVFEQVATMSNERLLGDKTFSINITADNLSDTNFVSDIKNALSHWNISAHSIQFEITEQSLVDDLELSLSNIREAAALGFDFLLDDFGTGYSSLQMLRSLPIKGIKIDKVFVKDIGRDIQASSFIQSMITLCHIAGHYVVGEGVETQSQEAVLAALQCDRLQGYYYARPLAAGDVIRALTDKP